MRKVHLAIVGLLAIAAIALAICFQLISRVPTTTAIAADPSNTQSVAATEVNSELEAEVLQIIHNHPEAIIESIQAYQIQQEEQAKQAGQQLLAQIKDNPTEFIGNSPTLGADNDRVVLIEFSDFQCPFCAKAHSTVDQFIQQNNQQVKLVFKFLPLASIHPQAVSAARGAWAAAQQNQFWSYHDALFNQQEQLGEQLYLQIAQDLDLDIEQFNRDRNSQASLQAIQKDLTLAQQLAINGTPFFIMNGQTLSGAVSLTQLERLLTQVSNS